MSIPSVHLIWKSYYSNGQLAGMKRKGSFWWRTITKPTDQYKGIAQTVIGNGDTIQFWDDQWQGRVLKYSFPELYFEEKLYYIGSCCPN